MLDGGPGCEGFLGGRKIYVDEQARPERRAFAISHELSHWLLRRAGIPDEEDVVNYLGAATLLPRLAFEADLRRWGWDLLRLKAKHTHASFEAIARRICVLRDARACVFDWPLAGQRDAGAYVIPWHDAPAPSPEEREAAHAAREYGAPVELRPGLKAWPVIEHDWHRVITVANV